MTGPVPSCRNRTIDPGRGCSARQQAAREEADRTTRGPGLALHGAGAGRVLRGGGEVGGEVVAGVVGDVAVDVGGWLGEPDTCSVASGS